MVDQRSFQMWDSSFLFRDSQFIFLKKKKKFTYPASQDPQTYVSESSVIFLWLKVCYSWWVLSSLIMIDRVHWIDKEKLAKFILDCQVFFFLLFVPKLHLLWSICFKLLDVCSHIRILCRIWRKEASQIGQMMLSMFFTLTSELQVACCSNVCCSVFPQFLPSVFEDC